MDQADRRSTRSGAQRATIAALFAVMGCSEKAQPGWTLFAYPAGIEEGSVVTPGFASKDLCLFAGNEAVRAYKASRSRVLEDEDDADPTFECGRECRPQRDLGGLLVCRETVK